MLRVLGHRLHSTEYVASAIQPGRTHSIFLLLNGAHNTLLTPCSHHALLHAGSLNCWFGVSCGRRDDQKGWRPGSWLGAVMYPSVACNVYLSHSCPHSCASLPDQGCGPCTSQSAAGQQDMPVSQYSRTAVSLYSSLVVSKIISTGSSQPTCQSFHCFEIGAAGAVTAAQRFIMNLNA